MNEQQLLSLKPDWGMVFHDSTVDGPRLSVRCIDNNGAPRCYILSIDDIDITGETRLQLRQILAVLARLDIDN